MINILSLIQDKYEGKNVRCTAVYESVLGDKNILRFEGKVEFIYCVYEIDNGKTLYFGVNGEEHEIDLETCYLEII